MTSLGILPDYVYEGKIISTMTMTWRQDDEDGGLDDNGDDDIINILPSFQLFQRNCAVYLLKLLLLIQLQQLLSRTNRYLFTSATIIIK